MGMTKSISSREAESLLLKVRTHSRDLEQRSYEQGQCPYRGQDRRPWIRYSTKSDRRERFDIPPDNSKPRIMNGCFQWGVRRWYPLIEWLIESDRKLRKKLFRNYYRMVNDANRLARKMKNVCWWSSVLVTKITLYISNAPSPVFLPHRSRSVTNELA